ncbi:MAG: sensor histidine kinase [Lachnospiraceae bacterium]|nr:sensor histidine kinase [Lachnospiraceae bacterium]
MTGGFIRHSFKRQLFWIFLSVTLTLVILGGVLTIQGFQARIRSAHEKTDEGQEKVINSIIVKILDLSEKTLEEVRENEMVMRALSGEEANPQTVYAALYEASTDVRSFAVVELFSEGRCLFSTGQVGASGHLPEGYSILREASEHPGEAVYAVNSGHQTAYGPELVIAMKIVGKPKAGYALVRISGENVEDALKGSINARDGFIFANSHFRPVCSVGTAEDGKDLELIRDNLFNGKKYTEGSTDNIYISEAGHGLLCIYITPPAFEPAAVRTGYQIVGAMVILSVVICLAAATVMSGLVTKPLNILSAAMRHFRKGDFDTKIEIDRDDEFGQLATGFNKMTSQLKATINERVETQKRLNEARIEMMQAQLNPHFLYNTLDTIKWVAKANQVPEVATLSASLAGLLRTSISADQFILLKNELETVRNYCDIQRIRFDDSFDLNIRVSSELENLYVPKLILQPLVENSIIHGFEGMSHGHIGIDACREGDRLRLTITDNGRGISDDMIRALENDDPEALKGHLGFNNVNTIIRIYFGKEYGVGAERPEYGGTRITVTLPVLHSIPVL